MRLKKFPKVMVVGNLHVAIGLPLSVEVLVENLIEYLVTNFKLSPITNILKSKFPVHCIGPTILDKMRGKKGYKKHQNEVLVPENNEPTRLNISMGQDEASCATNDENSTFETLEATSFRGALDTKSGLEKTHGMSHGTMNRKVSNTNDDTRDGLLGGGKSKNNVDPRLSNLQEVIDKFVHKTRSLQMENEDLSHQVVKLEEDLREANKCLEEEEHRSLLNMAQKCDEEKYPEIIKTEVNHVEVDTNLSKNEDLPKFDRDHKDFQIEIVGLKHEQNNTLAKLSAIIEERNELTNNMSISMNEQKTLKEKLILLQDENTKLRSFGADLSETITILQINVKNLERDKSSVQTSLQKCEDERKSLQDRFDELYSHTMSLKDTLLEYEHENSILRGCLKNEEYERDQITKTLHAMDSEKMALVGELKRSEDVRKILSNEFRKSESERVLLQEGLKKIEFEKSSFNEVLKNVEVEWVAVRNKLQKVESENMSMKETIQRVESKNQILSVDLEHQQFCGDNHEVDDLKKIIGTLEGELETSKIAIAYLEDSLRNSRSGRAPLENDLHIASTECNLLRDCILKQEEVITFTKGEVGRLELEKVELIREVSSLSDQLLAQKLSLVNENNELESALSNSRREVEEVLIKFEDTKHTMSRYKLETSSLMSEVHRLSSFSECLIESNAQLQELSNEKTTELIELKIQIEEKGKVIENLQVDLHSAIQDGRSTSGLATEAQVNLEHARLMISQMEGTIIATQLQSTNLQSEVEALQSAVKESTSLILMLQERRLDLESQCLKAVHSLGLLDDKLDTMEVAFLDDEKGLRSELDVAFSQVSTLSESVRKVIVEAEAVREENEDVQASLDTAAEAKGELEANLASLQTSHVELEARLASLQVSNSDLQATASTMERRLEKSEAEASGDKEELRDCKVELADVKRSLDKALIFSREKENVLVDSMRQLAILRAKEHDKLRLRFSRGSLLSREILVTVLVVLVGVFTMRMSKRPCTSPTSLNINL